MNPPLESLCAYPVIDPSKLLATCGSRSEGQTLAAEMFSDMADVAQTDINHFKEHIEADFARRAPMPNSSPPSPATVDDVVIEELR